jgi:hypothetical protein
MANFFKRQNFSSRPQYSIDLTVVSSETSGGTQLSISANLVKHTAVNNTPNSSGTPRSYSVPNGRTTSTNGSLVVSGGDSNMTFNFTSNNAGESFTIYSGFNRFVQAANGTMSVTVSASHSLLGSADATISNIPQIVTVVNRTVTFNGNGGTTPSSQTVSQGSTISLPSSSRSGYTFDYWIIGGSAYSAGQNYTVNSDVTATASWTINTPAPVFSNGINIGDPARIGENWSDSIFASDTTSYQLISGLPGQSLNVVSGTAYIVGTVQGPTGEYTIQIRANGPGGSTDTYQYNVTVIAALPVWADTSIATTGRVGTNYSSNISASDATSWVIGGSLPPGINTSGTSSETVTFSGSPSAAGDYSFNATPRNSANESGSTEYFSISVLPRIPVWSDNTLSNLARVGVAYTSTVSVNYVQNWSVVSLENIGLSFNAQTSESGFSTSTLSGTPTNFGTLDFSLTPRNSANETATTENYSITIYDASMSWSDQTLTSGAVVQGEAYSDQVLVAAGPVSVSYSSAPGFALPSGLSVSSTTGAITGSVATPGTYSFKIRATNGSAEFIETNTLTLVVEVAGGYVKVWNGSSWVDGTVNVRTAGAWVEGTVQVRSISSWITSFTS